MTFLHCDLLMSVNPACQHYKKHCHGLHFHKHSKFLSRTKFVGHFSKNHAKWNCVILRPHARASHGRKSAWPASQVSRWRVMWVIAKSPPQGCRSNLHYLLSEWRDFYETLFSRKDFNRGLAIGILFCLLFWASVVWFVCGWHWKSRLKSGAPQVLSRKASSDPTGAANLL